MKESIRRHGWGAAPLVLPVVLLIVWWFYSRGSESPYFPPLQKSIAAFRQTWLSSRFLDEALPSLVNFAIGFGVAAAIGLFVGVPLGLSSRVRRALSPILEFLRATPIAALVPVSLVLLGSGRMMEVALIAFGACWPILISAQDGIRGVDQAMLDAGRSYGMSSAQRLWRIRLPAATPHIFSGLRVGVAVGLQAMVLANMFGGSNGLGHFVLYAQSTFDIPAMWAGVFLLAICAAVIAAALELIERKVLAWHRGWRRVHL